MRTRRLAYAPFFPPEALDAMSVTKEAASWRTRIGGETSRTITAVDGKDVIGGFTHINWNDGELLRTGEIEYMYVATQHQGNGLGARLMAEAEAALASMSLTDAVLWVYEANTPARGFYERCGWADDGARRESTSAPGQYLARYRKPLGL